MAVHCARWTGLCAVVLCTAFGVTSGGKMVITEHLSVCTNDTLLKAAVQEHQGDGGQRVFSGYLYSPVDIDETIRVVVKVHMPRGDGWAERPLVLNVQDPCIALRTVMPNVLQALATMTNCEAKCPIRKGNYTISDQTLKMPMNIAFLPLGTYKVHSEAFKGETKALCADAVFKLVNE